MLDRSVVCNGILTVKYHPRPLPRSRSIRVAAADSDQKVVTIHPAAIKNYLADVELMRAALEDDKAAERPEMIEPLRRLIHSVVVHASPGVKGFEVEIKGRLHELIDRPLVGGGRMVAGDCVGHNSRQQSIAYPRIIELGVWCQSLVDALN